MATGKLIFVSGYSGAGKSTLVGAALAAVAGLEYLVTTTTRPAREGEAERSFEYRFADRETYAKLRAKSALWDEGEYAGNYYGADVAGIKKSLAAGKHIICCMMPIVATIRRMGQLYDVKPVLIWIDTPLEVANRRIALDTRRSKRLDDPAQSQARGEEIKRLANIIYAPSGEVAASKQTFVELIQSLVR